MIINLNDTVYFTLTDYGYKRWLENRDEFYQSLPEDVAKKFRDDAKANGNKPPTSMQLWSFMQTFGKYFWSGNGSPVTRCEISLGSPLQQLAEVAE